MKHGEADYLPVTTKQLCDWKGLELTPLTYDRVFCDVSLASVNADTSVARIELAIGLQVQEAVDLSKDYKAVFSKAFNTRCNSVVARRRNLRVYSSLLLVSCMICM